jgi:deazaflavin-dependent oxidoreductase (nitroreductase family)
MSDSPRIRGSRHRNRLDHVGFANTVVEKILESPAHPVLSGSTVLIRYTGRRTGTEYTTPVQYADAHVGYVVLVGKPETKTWWRNFTEMGQMKVLLKGTWTPMTAHALRGVDDPEAVEPLLRSYALRYPRVVKSLDGDTLEARVRGAVVVWLRPA